MGIAASTPEPLAPSPGVTLPYAGVTEALQGMGEYDVCWSDAPVSTRTLYHLACAGEPSARWHVGVVGAGERAAPFVRVARATGGALVTSEPATGGTVSAWIPPGPGLTVVTVAACGTGTVAASTSAADQMFWDEPYGLAVTAGDCPAGRVARAGRCIDPQTDATACGAPGLPCGVGQSCVGGVCRCPGGQTACAGRCVDLTGDMAHCGTCGAACPVGDVCAAGRCTPAHGTGPGTDAGAGAGANTGAPGTVLPTFVPGEHGGDFAARFTFPPGSMPYAALTLPVLAAGGMLRAEVPLLYDVHGQIYAGPVDVAILRRATMAPEASLHWTIEPLRPRSTGADAGAGAPGDTLLQRIQTARAAVARVGALGHPLAGAPVAASPSYAGLDGTGVRGARRTDRAADPWPDRPSGHGRPGAHGDRRRSPPRGCLPPE